MCDETGGCRFFFMLLLRKTGNFRGVCPEKSGRNVHAGCYLDSEWTEKRSAATAAIRFRFISGEKRNTRERVLHPE